MKLKVGDQFPDVTLPDEEGVKHTLSELQGDDCAVVMLGRGEHCPRERQHQHHMRLLHEWSDVAFTQLVTILPNTPHDVFRMKAAAGAHWTFLADEDLEVQELLDIREYTDSHHAATVPHTLVLAPDRTIDKIYVGYWYWGRPSAYDLWADLRDLHQRIKPDYDPLTAEARKAWEAGQGAPAHA